MPALCVFCGSKEGRDPRFLAAATEVGAAIAARGLGLVYGGARHGLMGQVATAALAAGGRVVGVIPRTLMRSEFPHPGLSALHLVDSMAERKGLMGRLADGFVALPGGFGTLDELFEVLTERQLALHGKPVGLLDLNGYFTGLVQWLDRAVDEGFVPAQLARVMRVETTPRALVDALADQLLASPP